MADCLHQPGVSYEDRATCLSRLRAIYGEDPARIEQCRRFMLNHCRPIGAKPVDALKDHLGRVRLLDFLKDCMP